MRVRFVMELEAYNEGGSYPEPTAANLQRKMHEVLMVYRAKPNVDPTWSLLPKILRTILIQDDGSKTAV